MLFIARSKIIFIILIVSPVYLFSQKMTLEECINYAIKNNLQVKQSLLNIEVAEKDLLQSKANILPSINGFASHNYSFGKTIDPFTNQFATNRIQSNSFSISASFSIFKGFQTINSIKQSQYNYLSKRYDADKIKNDISINVALAFLQVLFNKEILKSANTQVNLSKMQVENTKKLVKAGILTEGDLLQIQSQLSNDELQQINAQNQLKISFLNLKQLLELPDTADFDIVAPEINDKLLENAEVLNLTPYDIYQNAISFLPEIKSSEYKIKSAEQSIKIAKGLLMPQLTFNASYGTGYSQLNKEFIGIEATGYDTIGFTSSGESVLSPSYRTISDIKPFKDQLNDNINQSIGFRLTIPVFNNFNAQIALSKAKLNYKISQLNYEQNKNQLYKAIEQAYTDAQAAMKKFYASVKNYNANKASFQYSKKKFELGVIKALDFNDAKNKFLKSQFDLIKAKYDYIFKIKILEFYQGKSIKL